LPGSDVQPGETLAAAPEPASSVQPGEYEETSASPALHEPAAETQPAEVPVVAPAPPILAGQAAGAKPPARPAAKKRPTAKAKRKPRKKGDLTWLLLPVLGVAALIVIRFERLWWVCFRHRSAA